MSGAPGAFTPASASSSEPPPRGLRSKGLLPAVGVGGAVYLVTGAVSMGTLAMIGIGVGVGYGVGGWLSEQYERKKQEKEQAAGRGSAGFRSSAYNAPSAPSGSTATLEANYVNQELQVSLMRWQAFLSQRAQGRQLAPPELETLFAEFSLAEPEHARNVQTVQQLVKSQREAEGGSAPSPGAGPADV